MLSEKLTLASLKQNPDYKILFENPYLNKNIHYLTLGGSRAYGTFTETSDTDIRGFFLEQPKDILGLISPKEEYVYQETDTVLYSFRRFMKLLSDCNPNTIELIGTREQEIIYQSELAEEVRNNYHLFLSKKAFKTFIGYATQQLRRLENALARDSYTQPEKELHIQKSLETQFLSGGMPNSIPPSAFSFEVKDSDKENIEKEIFVSVNLNDVPLRDFLNTEAIFSNTLRNFGKLNKRNHKKDKDHLDKHAMHLIRLHFMGIDILKNEEIHTYREKEHDLLMSIRNGQMPYNEIFEMQRELEAEMKDACKNSKLPENPRMEEISDFTARMMKKYLF